MQAARGTPLGAGEEPAAASRGPSWTIFAAIAVAFYALDQATKVWAVDALTGAADRPLIGDLLQLRLTRNPGAAFSTGTQFTEALTCLAIVAVVVVLFLSRRLGSTGWAIALGFLLAGVAGNLTDRMIREPGAFRGHVVDFLMLPNWPIFNVADICINIAVGVIILQVIRGIRIDGSLESPDDEADETDESHSDDGTPVREKDDSEPGRAVDG